MLRVAIWQNYENQTIDSGLKRFIFAGKVKSQIDSLLHAAVRPEDITVAGTSKGGYIAQYVSSLRN
jgi:hypothetical protein